MFANLIPHVLGVDTTIVDLGAKTVGFSGLAFDAQSLITVGVTVLLAVVSLTFFFILVLGGLKWISSGGDEKKLAAARAQITNALIGLVIVFSAWAIAGLIKSVFGVDILKIKIPTV